jgi:hypothetical protein
VNRKIKFQEGGRTTPYNPMGHLTNPEEAEKRRVAGNKGRTPANKKGKYWWSEYTDPFTKPVDKFLSGALGPAAKPVQGLLSLGTPAEAVNKALDKPTAGNIIEAAADTAATAAGVKAILGTGKAVNKAGRAVKATPPAGEKDMGKYSVAKSLFETGKKAFKNTSDEIKANSKAQRAAPSRKNPGNAGKFTPSGAKPKPVKSKAAANPKAKPTPVTPKAAANPKPTPVTPKAKADFVVPKKGPPRAPGAGAVVPRKPTAAAVVPSKSGFNLKSPKRNSMSTAQKVALTALGTGAAGAALSPTEPMTGNAEPVPAKKIPGTGGSSSKPSAQTPSANKTKASSSSSKPKKDPTEGGDYKSYSKDNNDFMYMTQQGYDKQEMEDMGGEKFGGRPGKGNLKTQGMNKTAKRKAGFSGKGSGAALRGF